jgi:hypothetical protein
MGRSGQPRARVFDTGHARKNDGGQARGRGGGVVASWLYHLRHYDSLGNTTVLVPTPWASCRCSRWTFSVQALQGRHRSEAPRFSVQPF